MYVHVNLYVCKYVKTDVHRARTQFAWLGRPQGGVGLSVSGVS